MSQKRILYMSQLVSDQDKALDFYTNVLGFQKDVENPTPGGPRFLSVGLKGQEFKLVLWPGTPGRAQPANGHTPATCTIETPDCRKDFEALKARGVTFETDVLEFPWGYVAVFVDPDGNRLQLRQGK
jgi:predicted enzyme related to lactoylglutathione lyase